MDYIQNIKESGDAVAISRKLAGIIRMFLDLLYKLYIKKLDNNHIIYILTSKMNKKLLKGRLCL